MRTAFIETLFKLALEDPRIMLITGDLGFGVLVKYMKAYPDQFVNAGVAEQNMTGMAAGMALSGKIVFTYSIANFPTLRPFEQIRNDVCYHNANVRIVSVGGGMAYGSLGISHHATEDIAVMRALPNMVVIAPGDPVETTLATHELINHDGPVYFRLGRAGEPVVHQHEPEFEIGKALALRQGDDITLISTGGLLHETMLAAESLAEKGLQSRLLSMHTVKPLDIDAVLQAADETQAIFTIEEHSIIGGLGGAVAETLLEANQRPRYFKRIGLNGEFSSIVGTQKYLRQQYGLDANGITRTVLDVLESKQIQNNVIASKPTAR